MKWVFKKYSQRLKDRKIRKIYALYNPSIFISVNEFHTKIHRLTPLRENLTRKYKKYKKPAKFKFGLCQVATSLTFKRLHKNE